MFTTSHVRTISQKHLCVPHWLCNRFVEEGNKLMWTSFYDDFISYSRPLFATNTEGTITTLFKLLGWAFAEAGDKCIPFAHVCEALGVAFNLSKRTMRSERFNHLQTLDGSMQNIINFVGSLALPSWDMVAQFPGG